MGQMIFIDVETTGLCPETHEIIEIAIIGSGIQYHRKVKPLNIASADENALHINGYNCFQWREAHHPRSIAHEVAHLIKGCTIVGHNPRFDMSFVDELLHQYDCDVWYDRKLIDTTVLAHEHLVPCGLNSASMDSIRDFFGWSKIGSHSALKDAKDCMMLYYKLCRASALKRFIWTNKKRFNALLACLL